MPKISGGGGPSHAAADAEAAALAQEAAAAGTAPVYDAQTILQLRELARTRGLSPAGAKAQLVQRLTQHDARQPLAGIICSPFMRTRSRRPRFTPASRRRTARTAESRP